MRNDAETPTSKTCPKTENLVKHIRMSARGQGGRSKYTVKEDEEPTRVSVQADALGRRLSPSRA